MFATNRADFGHPLPALRSVTEPLESILRQMFLTVFSFQFLEGYADTILFAPYPCSCNVCILILSTEDSLPISVKSGVFAFSSKIIKIKN